MFVVVVTLKGVITLGSEAILAGFTRREVGHQFTEEALDGALADLVVFRLVAGVIHHGSVGDGETGAVTGRVVSVRVPR